MIAALALLLSGIVSAIAVLHAHWGLGGVWPADSAERLAKAAVGTPGITTMPSVRSAVFLGRGLAGYTSAWRRRFSEQPFARLDRLAYSPLCLALGAGFLAILIAGGTQ